MHYFLYQPSVSLQRFIRFFWTFECNANPTTPFNHWAVASGSSKLVFQYRGSMHLEDSSGTSQKLFLAGLQAQTQLAQHFVSHQDVGLLGVYFHPGALALLLSIPAHELTNQNIALSSLLGQPGRDLEEKIMLAGSNRERIQILTAFFENRLTRLSKSDMGILGLIQAISDGQGLLPIQELVDRYYLSQRQIERRFKTVAGLSPKQLSRIIRFENSIRVFLEHPASLTETAYVSGYSDQSHFIRDVREFTGEQPTAYFSQDFSMFGTV